MNYSDQDDDRADYLYDEARNDKYEQDQARAAALKATLGDRAKVAVAAYISTQDAGLSACTTKKCPCGYVLLENNDIFRCLWCTEEVLP